MNKDKHATDDDMQRYKQQLPMLCSEPTAWNLLTAREQALKRAIDLQRYRVTHPLPERFEGFLGELGWKNFLAWLQVEFTHCASCYNRLLYTEDYHVEEPEDE